VVCVSHFSTTTSDTSSISDSARKPTKERGEPVLSAARPTPSPAMSGAPAAERGLSNDGVAAAVTVTGVSAAATGPPPPAPSSSCSLAAARVDRASSAAARGTLPHSVFPPASRAGEAAGAMIVIAAAG
jgi:hypothetical protein